MSSGGRPEQVVVPGWVNEARVLLGRLLPRTQYVKAAKRSLQR
jgi:hypothetical protein